MRERKVAAFGILLFSAMLVASITMTVAWYQGASYMEIDGFDISVKSPDLQLSTDNEYFQDSLSKDSLQKVDNFKPISSYAQDEWMASHSTEPIFYQEYDSIDSEIMSADKATITSSGFFSQDIYIKCSQSYYISFVGDDELKKDEQPLFVANEKANLERAKRLVKLPEYQGYTVEEITERLNGVIHSMRISVLVLEQTGDNADQSSNEDYAYYIVDPYKNSDTYIGGILDADLSGSYDSFSGKEVVYGDVTSGDKAKYDASQANDSTLEGELTCFNSTHQKGVQRFNQSESENAGLTIAKEKSIALEDIDSFEEGNLGMNFPLYKDVSRRLRLSIYLEGWDLDNTNCTMFGSFYVNLKFKMSRPIL